MLLAKSPSGTRFGFDAHSAAAAGSSVVAFSTGCANGPTPLTVASTASTANRRSVGFFTAWSTVRAAGGFSRVSYTFRCSVAPAAEFTSPSTAPQISTAGDSSLASATSCAGGVANGGCWPADRSSIVGPSIGSKWPSRSSLARSEKPTCSRWSAGAVPASGNTATFGLSAGTAAGPAAVSRASASSGTVERRRVIRASDGVYRCR